MERHQAVVETAAEGIITYDFNGEIHAFNRSAKRIFACEHSQPRDIRELFATSDSTRSVLFPSLENNPTATPDADREFDEEIPAHHELIGIRSTGKKFPAEVATSILSENETELITILVRDVARKKKFEARLSHAQKMESVGQLAAGVAHEINTPIQFIGDNIKFIRQAFENVGSLLDQYDALSLAIKNRQEPSTMIQQLETYRETIDYQFLRSELPEAVTQTLEGVERVATIVRAMRELSQPATEEKTKVNLNRVLENVVAISSNHYRDIAEIQLDLDPKLGTINCLSEEINQTCLNILSNAVEAIAENRDQPRGLIAVSTRRDEEEVEVRFEDNGPGIPEAVKNRIFDPFFTTKEVGKGMGQGLAFVYESIVHRHDGTIEVTSPPGGGTTIVIRLPRTDRKEGVRQEHASSSC